MSNSMFILNDEQLQQVRSWKSEHKCTLRDEMGNVYVGAIGGAYTYCFTPTGLDTIITVSCGCGEKIDLTDYESW